MISAFGFVWREISADYIKKCLGKDDLMCKYDDEFFFIEKTDVPPDYIRFDFLIKGSWYIRVN